MAKRLQESPVSGKNCDDCVLRLFFPTSFCKSYLNQLVQLAWAASEKSKMNKSSLYTI